jgi:hypothetical protein
MSSIKYRFGSLLVFAFALALSLSTQVIAEEEKSQQVEELTPSQQTTPITQQQNNSPVKKEKKDKRYFGTEKDPRIDAGIFHVAFAAGANFFIEPKLNATTKAPIGEYFNDFGYGGGVVFDYDYSQMTENIPLMLRGYVGYKYILNSVHVFDVEGIARRMWQFSDTASFGVGAGVSTAVWYRTLSDSSPYEETLFLPSFVLETGFEFNPVMVQLKWLVNRLGSDSSINGIEFMVGVRL